MRPRDYKDGEAWKKTSSEALLYVMGGCADHTQDVKGLSEGRLEDSPLPERRERVGEKGERGGEGERDVAMIRMTMEAIKCQRVESRSADVVSLVGL